MGCFLLEESILINLTVLALTIYYNTVYYYSSTIVLYFEKILKTVITDEYTLFWRLTSVSPLNVHQVKLTLGMQNQAHGQRSRQREWHCWFSVFCSQLLFSLFIVSVSLRVSFYFILFFIFTFSMNQVRCILHTGQAIMSLQCFSSKLKIMCLSFSGLLFFCFL